MGFFYMKNILKIVFVIIGTLIGAGFASGKEIYTFFYSYGEKGIFGIIISSLLIGIIIYNSLRIIKEKEIDNYKEFLDEITPKGKNKNFKKVIQKIINLFILISFYIMISGFGAYCNQQFSINPFIGSTILAIISWLTIRKDIKGVVLLNEIIVPILIIFLIVIEILNITQIDILNLSGYIIQTNHSNYILSGILYSSYNAILLIPVLITLKNYLTEKKDISKISIIVTIITIILSIIIFTILIKVDVNIENLEMPVAYVISNIYPYLKIIYAIILLSSILTTSISLGNSFIENVAKEKKKKTKILNFICISSVLVSGIGFSNLVNNLYPIFGFLGLIQIFAIGIKGRSLKSLLEGILGTDLKKSKKVHIKSPY